MMPLDKFRSFLRGEPGALIPSMPIFMRFAAKYSGVKYRDFCLDAALHCQANIKCAEDFHSDWVNVMSDAYGEAEAFGLPVEYPEDNLPFEKNHLSIEDIKTLKLCAPDHYRIKGRVEQIAEFKRRCGNKYLICGWVEGLVAEYCDLRGMSDAFFDIFDCPDLVKKAMSIILENAKNFATEQIKAGAHCIGIGDAACSQLGNEHYQEFAWQGEKELVEHIHSLGALAKLHICGDTTAIMPGMIATGADIIDVDHQVRDISSFVPLLSGNQVFCGNLDPVRLLQNADPVSIRLAGLELIKNCQGKIIVSGGCEITPGTPPENILALASLNNGKKE